MLGIEPLEFHYIAFMIRATSLLAYSTQPDKEVVAPRSMYSVTITLQAQEKKPGTVITHRKKDKFTVLSTTVDEGVTAADISEDMFDEEEDKVFDKVNVTVILGTQ